MGRLPLAAFQAPRDTGKWGVLYQIAKWGFVANLLAVLYHTLHFFTQRIPVN